MPVLGIAFAKGSVVIVTVSVQEELLEAAARLLAVDGPTALTTRRVAAEAGTSTMGVYTHFGSIAELVQAVVVEGFRRLGSRLQAVPRTDDALTDLAGLAAAYHAHAMDNPHLYTVMFGTASLGGFRRTAPDQLQIGRDTFDQFTDTITRAMETGRIRRTDPVIVTGEVWAVLHGGVLLQSAGFLPSPSILSRSLGHLLAGLGAEDVSSLAFHE